MASLYELDAQLMAIDSLLEQNENQETKELLEGAREVLMPEIETKMVSILTYISNCEGKIDYLKKEIARLQEKIKSLSNKKEFLKNLAHRHMENRGETKAEYGSYTLTIAKTPAKVVLNEEELQFLPETLCTKTVTPNKTLIKEAMTGGKLIVEVDGQMIEIAHLETSTALRIK